MALFFLRKFGSHPEWRPICFASRGIASGEGGLIYGAPLIGGERRGNDVERPFFIFMYIIFRLESCQINELRDIFPTAELAVVSYYYFFNRAISSSPRI